jgi:uncharacterized protein
MLYVQPVYVKSANANAYPLMRLVLVSYGSQVGNGTSLADAIANLLSKGSSGPPATGPPAAGQPPPTTGTPTVLTGDLATAAAKIDAAIEKLRQAQVSGDFAAQGQAMADLDAATKEFEAAAKAAGVNPSATAIPTG